MPTSCAPTVRKLAQGSNPSKLMTIFADELPDSVRVKGTSDINKVNPAGHWISKEKYDVPNKTLELLDGSGAVLRECTYDNNGNATSPCSVLFMSNGVSRSGSNVTVIWDVASEQGITKYLIEAAPDDVTFTSFDEQTFDTSKGGSYSKMVSPPAGTVFFRLTAVCSGGAKISSDAFN